VKELRVLTVCLVIFLLLYGSFIAVEKGVMEIHGRENDSRALSLSCRDRIVYIIFAGERYEIDLIEVYSFISRIFTDIKNSTSLSP